MCCQGRETHTWVSGLAGCGSPNSAGLFSLTQADAHSTPGPTSHSLHAYISGHAWQASLPGTFPVLAASGKPFDWAWEDAAKEILPAAYDLVPLPFHSPGRSPMCYGQMRRRHWQQAVHSGPVISPRAAGKCQRNWLCSTWGKNPAILTSYSCHLWA